MSNSFRVWLRLWRGKAGVDKTLEGLRKGEERGINRRRKGKGNAVKRGKGNVETGRIRKGKEREINRGRKGKGN